MSWSTCALLALLLAAGSRAEQHDAEGQQSILDCAYEANSVACANRRMARELDRIETQIVGKPSQVPVSKLIEEGGSLIADGVQAIFGPEEDDNTSSDPATQVDEARKKTFGKKKKKHLQKLIMIGMLLKSKIGLLLQLLSTHFQMKFFVIAVVSLLINAARFWIDLKKSHRPSKVIYYEHAQHQHHYDHDDDHGLWGRSSVENPQDLAYNGYAPEE